MANPITELFEWFDRKREQWQKQISGSDQIARGNARDAAIRGFDYRLALALGHPIPKLSKGMSPTQRALAAAKTKDEATSIYDAAVAAAATKYKNTSGGRYKKAVKKYAAYRDKAVTSLDKMYADASGKKEGVTGSTPDQKTGGTKPPDSKKSLTEGSSSSSSEEGQNWFLWVGVALLGWWYFRR